MKLSELEELIRNTDSTEELLRTIRVLWANGLISLEEIVALEKEIESR